MSSLYLDIIKDRLYIEKADSVQRKSAQTTMYYILDSLVKILTPMISFTAEEMWKAMKHTKTENVESPMLTDYPVVVERWNDEKISAKWKKVIDLKTAVAKELELARAEKLIGNSLDAKVTLTANSEDYNFLKENESLLKIVLIVSGLKLVEDKNHNKTNKENSENKEEKIKIEVAHADGEKCQRCWMYDEHTEDGLCPRCKEILEK
jgi:isoleucyl-tRNA synthetase